MSPSVFIRPIFLSILLFSSHLLLAISYSKAQQNVMADKLLNIIELADTDGDGRINVETEMKQFLESNKFERMFKLLFDHQPKGELRLDSFKRILLRHFAGRKYISQLSTLADKANVNKNGGIDWHEFKLFMYGLGEQLVDVNHDGFITPEESLAFYTWENMLEE